MASIRKPELALDFAKKTRAPKGYVRLTVNIKRPLHKRLKIAAAKQETTAGKLIEAFIKEHL